MPAPDVERVLADAFAHALAAWPEEACGLLLGGADGQVVTTRRMANRAQGRDRFELEPLELLQAEDEARRAGLVVAGVYHSHPDGGPEPSAADTESARCLWRDRSSWLYLILGVRDGAATGRLWRFADGWRDGG